MSKVNVVKGYTAVGASPAMALVYGCPVPVAHLTISGSTEQSFSLDVDTMYVLQASDVELQFKLHESGTSPGPLYTRVQAKTDFPFVAPGGLFLVPFITMSGVGTSAGPAILNKMVR